MTTEYVRADIYDSAVAERDNRIAELEQRDRVISRQLERSADGADLLHCALRARIAELEAENKTFRAAQKACEDCDGDAFERLRAERDALAREVREWLCDDCNTVYPGPPAEGCACVVCPKCGGKTGPALTVENRKLRSQRDALAAEVERLQSYERETLFQNLGDWDAAIAAQERNCGPAVTAILVERKDQRHA